MDNSLTESVWDNCIKTALEDINVNEKGKQKQWVIKENPKFSMLDSIDLFKAKFFEVIGGEESMSKIINKVENYLDKKLKLFFEKKAVSDLRKTSNVPTILWCTSNNEVIKINLKQLNRLIERIKQNMNEEYQKVFSVTKNELKDLIDDFS